MSSSIALSSFQRVSVFALILQLIFQYCSMKYSCSYDGHRRTSRLCQEYRGATGGSRLLQPRLPFHSSFFVGYPGATMTRPFKQANSYIIKGAPTVLSARPLKAVSSRCWHFIILSFCLFRPRWQRRSSPASILSFRLSLLRPTFTSFSKRTPNHSYTAPMHLYSWGRHPFALRDPSVFPGNLYY